MVLGDVTVHHPQAGVGDVQQDVDCPADANVAESTFAEPLADDRCHDGAGLVLLGDEHRRHVHLDLSKSEVTPGGACETAGGDPEQSRGGLLV